MGWTSTSIWKSEKTTDFLKKEINSARYEVLAIGNGQRAHGESVYYSATQDNLTGQVFAVVTLVKRKNGEIAWKDIEETCGPLQYDCPEKIFKLLTPIKSEFANNWRAKVAENIAKKKTTPKVVIGTKVKFANPINFTNGYSGDEFIFNGGSKFKPVEGYGAYRITNWKSNEYEVVA